MTPSKVPVAAAAAAGIEVLVHTLASALSSRDWSVHVVGASGSRLPPAVVLWVATADTVRRTVQSIVQRVVPTVVCDHSEAGVANDLKEAFTVHHTLPRYCIPHAPARTAFVSGMLRGAFAEAWGAEWSECEIVRNGVLQSRGGPQRYDAKQFVYIGRVNRWKGIHRAAAAAMSAGASLQIWGGLPGASEDVVYNDYSYIREICNAYPSATYCGSITSRVARGRVLRGASGIVVPSLEPESCSLVSLEAAAEGTPVLTTASQHGIAEYLAGTIGFHVASQPDDAVVQELSTIMKGLCDSPRKYRPPFLPQEFYSDVLASRYEHWFST